jgi:thiamine biosynthesis lipoprotein
MKQTRLIMGMPITVEIVGASDEKLIPVFGAVFDYFIYIDEKFSTYKSGSEISKINRGEINESEQSDDMKIIFMLSEETKQRTGGFFDIRKPDGSRDPSGIVKGWAIWNAAKLIEKHGFTNFYVDAGGDIQTSGLNGERKKWNIGIRNPLTAGTPRQNEIVKVVYLSGEGIATSGTYIRGDHIYNPHGPAKNDIVSMTIIGPNIYEADRFATAAFAMGAAGIRFIEQLPKTSRLEGYIIDKNGIATMTTGFHMYTDEIH